MKDFWAWAGAHEILAFILMCVALILTSRIILAFFSIFHRTPRQVTLTDAQAERLTNQLKEQPRLEVINDVPTSRSQTWYERLTK